MNKAGNTKDKDSSGQIRRACFVTESALKYLTHSFIHSTNTYEGATVVLALMGLAAQWGRHTTYHQDSIQSL